MKENELLGLWKASGSVSKDGKEKTRAPKLKFEFLPGGVANMQLFWMKRQVKWQLTEDGVVVTNERSKKENELSFEDGMLVMHNADGSKAMLAKAGDRIKLSEKDIARSQPRGKRR